MNISSNILQPTSIVQRAREVLFSQLDDELLAIDAQAGFVYSLNDSASRVWDLIQSPTSVDAVCARLRREYAVDERTCQRDVLALLQALHEAELVQVHGAPAA